MNAIVTRSTDMPVDIFPWGELRWYARGAMGQPEFTLGFCILNPGQCNARHMHPTCAETLHVLSGSIWHTIEGEGVEMREGDSITVPAGVLHNARNLGEARAVLHIAFTSGERTTVNE